MKTFGCQEFTPTRKHLHRVFTVFRLLTDFVCLYNYEFLLSLCKIVRSSVILLLPLSIVYFLYVLYINGTYVIRNRYFKLSFYYCLSSHHCNIYSKYKYGNVINKINY